MCRHHAPPLEAKPERLSIFAIGCEKTVSETMRAMWSCGKLSQPPVLRDTHLGAHGLEPDLDRRDLIQRNARLPRESELRARLEGRQVRRTPSEALQFGRYQAPISGTKVKTTLRSILAITV